MSPEFVSYAGMLVRIEPYFPGGKTQLVTITYAGRWLTSFIAIDNETARRHGRKVALDMLPADQHSMMVRALIPGGS